MRIITVSGAHSGSGKTTLIESLLKFLNGWSALKVTVSHRMGSVRCVRAVMLVMISIPGF